MGFLVLKEGQATSRIAEQAKSATPSIVPISSLLREVHPGVRIATLRLAKYFYDSNPLARRIIELTKNFVLGEGLYFEAEDPQVFEVLQRFWNDDVNNWPVRQHERVLELCLYGEWFWPVSVNPSNGHVRLGYIDPLLVSQVIPNSQNPLIIEKVTFSAAGEFRELNVIKEDQDPRSSTFGYLVGDIFYFAINKVSNQLRGSSDLLPLIDWLDIYDQFLFNRMERQAFINNFAWDVTLEGADEKEIKDFIDNLPPPTPGTVRAHNERVKWSVVNPKLEGADAQQEASLIRSHILAGAGFPPHFFSDFSGVRATAYESYFPTEKNLVARQKVIKAFLDFVFRFVIDQAIIHGRLPKNVNRTFTIYFPEISIRDLERTSRALSNFVAALKTAREMQWLSDDECKRAVSSILTQIGLPYKTKKENTLGG
ncbi:MAG: hypothetical protein QXT73_00445 [Candidatus Methanomethylicaceae archaeon]